ncbi:DUF4258 domain-containing protein [Chitinophaga sp. Cy-1792]|uniref:DUF4258 domain-containing protein n=1 Tax=Chitinophaga sp. Cy-1792 TaxID=2608339 RepID=UPI0014208052|nr:DUF4258 domain-containing protein [Chitinophaga sp. Cy-1792]NIG53496.1 DUF4258 domain-containing protein [Chitinophaga sp. Cy-1792]
MKAAQKYLPVGLLALLLMAGWHQKWWRSEPTAAKPGAVVTHPPRPSAAYTGKLLNRRAHLEYTKHAKCRMDCRHVTEAEVEEILHDGNINLEKSNPNDHPCPTFALEGYSHDGQHLRIVFAPCDEENARVITCIDLDKDWTCHCE